MRKSIWVILLFAVLALALLLSSVYRRKAAEPVYQAGSATLVSQPQATNAEGTSSYLDLDTGSVTTFQTADSDIEFCRSGGTMAFNVFFPVNGAKSMLAGADEPHLDGCRQLAGSFTETNIPDFVRGRYLCVLTNQGRLAQVRNDEMDVLDNNAVSIQVSFVTWDAVATD